VLFRLPRVLAAVEASEPVYVVEGEKDVHAIEGAGATATTIIGGVNGRWLPEFSRLLAKTQVLVVADDDQPGRKRATATARAIARLGGKVEVVKAAVGKDAADHLAAGLTLADVLPADQEPDPVQPTTRPKGPQNPQNPRRPGSRLPPRPGHRGACLPGPGVPGVAGRLGTGRGDRYPDPDRPGRHAGAQRPRRGRGRAGRGGGPARLAGAAQPVHRPGSRKSAVVRDVTGPLLELERELVDAKAAAILEAGTASKVAERAAGKAAADQAQAALADAIAAARRAAGIQVPAPPRLLVDDATPEALASLLAEQGGRIALLSPEGDVFDMMAGCYAQGGGPNLGVYLTGHAGDPLRVDRKGRPPEHVDRPVLTVGLAVQPEVLRQIADRPGFRGRGLLARFLWALPAGTVGRRQVGAARCRPSSGSGTRPRSRRWPGPCSTRPRPAGWPASPSPDHPARPGGGRGAAGAGARVGAAPGRRDRGSGPRRGLGGKAGRGDRPHRGAASPGRAPARRLGPAGRGRDDARRRGRRPLI
jgi:putative DNA primase/helicase